ncbi:MAG TPA: amidohydrolase family protein [Woeseiaceae bacterium]|nr:amidohydrolase family protein [Woeseiaceae bacterium]
MQVSDVPDRHAACLQRLLASLVALGTLASLVPGQVQADVIVTEGTNITVDVAADGRIVTDLLGGIWLLPKSGGNAQAIASGPRAARRPRWSRDGSAIVFEANTNSRPTLWLYTFADDAARPLGDKGSPDREPDWNPDGSRIVFSSAEDGNNFDIWEMDVATGLRWRLTELPGRESEPAWSATGEDLLYVHEHHGTWSLVLRERGKTDEVLVESSSPIAAPSWRPDGSLVTYLQQGADGWQVQMTILSKPRLTRPLISNEDFFLAPIAWIDRQHMLYTADGQLRLRRFNSWTSSNLPFRANIGAGSSGLPPGAKPRDLPAIDVPTGRRIIRAARVYDGVGSSYLLDADVIIDGGRIASVNQARSTGDEIVIDLGDATVLPGYIDAYAALPPNTPASLGPLLLSLGVTTLISDDPDARTLNARWSGHDLPGPRVLPASPVESATNQKPYPWLITVSGDFASSTSQKSAVLTWQERGVAVLADSWQAALGSGARLLLGTNTRPVSPRGIRYQDVHLASDIGTLSFVSGLATPATPGVAEIWQSGQARLLAPAMTGGDAYGHPVDLAAAAPLLVLGSKPNGLPPGIALHAEIRALAASGLTNDQVLRSMGVNAAAVLGFGLHLGRVAVGAAADLVIVAGDPLVNIADTLKVIAVVRNGRFYSVSGLLERAGANDYVE